MPRKPKLQSRRPSAIVSARGSSLVRRARHSSPNTAPGRKFYQCLSCGALVDPMYGTGAGSWCPHCHESDEIYWCEGRLPDPQRYGMWLAEQQDKAQAESGGSVHSIPSPITPGSLTVQGDTTMKLRKLHTGVYSCPQCCVEYDLTGESVLKCEDCGGPLLEGSLADSLEDEGEAEEE